MSYTRVYDALNIQATAKDKTTLTLMQPEAMTSIQPEVGGNATIPLHLRLPKIRAGSDYAVYETAMDKVYKKNPAAFEALLKEHVARYNNISGSVIHFPSGDK